MNGIGGRLFIFLLVVCAMVVAGGSAHAGESDALALSANIQARHLPFGTILDPIFASSDSNQITGYTRCGDSAIWTGHYLAAEAFRYRVTQSPQALDNVRKAIAGIKSLMDVTGTNLLARCMVPVNSPYLSSIQGEENHNGIYPSVAAGWVWVGNTSRDQYAGVIFGLGVAYDMVEVADVKAATSEQTKRILDFLRAHDWFVVMPDGTISTAFLISPDEILAFLGVGQHMDPSRFSLIYDQERTNLAGSVLLPVSIHIASDNSYSKFNLDYITLYNLIRLESSSTVTIYRQAYDILRSHTAPHRNAFFNMIDRGLNGPNAARDSETLFLLDQWLQRPKRDMIVDLHGVVPVCGDQACQPVAVPLRPPTDFLWQRMPFQLLGGGTGTIETSGIDYILPYWMARYYGVNSRFVVQSAAAAVTVVAPESIASIYGSNLASRTEQAIAQPLPMSLGGISLTVKDASGSERGAGLIYVSPNQVNFVVPRGTAPGLATFTITSGGMTIAATGTVQSVVPSLFSVNGSGTGIAAATAVRTNAGNPALQFPIPVYQCDASGCTAVPLDVGLDTPVFVTFYGTGIRNRSSLGNVKVTINGVSVPVLYAGPQSSFEGLDQINVPLTLNLRGSGVSNVVLTVDGQTANTVTLNVR